MLAGGKPVFVATTLEDGFKLQPRGAREGHHAEDQVVDLQLAVQSVGRRLYARASSRR